MLIKPCLSLIRIQRERWIRREERKTGDADRKKNIRGNKKRQSHSGSEPRSRLLRLVTCCRMTHAVTVDGYVWMRHIWNIPARAASDLYRSMSAKGESQARVSNSVNFSVSPVCPCGAFRSLPMHVSCWGSPNTHPWQCLLLVQCILGFEGGLASTIRQEGTSWRQRQVVEDQQTISLPISNVAFECSV